MVYAAFTLFLAFRVSDGSRQGLSLSEIVLKAALPLMILGLVLLGHWFQRI
jgi:hypothetical protein